MKKVFAIILALTMCFSLAACGCRGVVLDENEVIEANGTEKVIKQGVTYTIDGNKVFADGKELYTIEGVKEQKLFLLGEYLYVNTSKGVVQAKLDGSAQKQIWSGDVKAAKGRWIYYQSIDNKQKTMTLYKIDMIEGRQLMLFADTMTQVKEIENNVFYFKGTSGNEYINELNNDDGMFYKDWLQKKQVENPTEATEATVGVE